MKKLLIILLIPILTYAGSEGRGGGDPDANMFAKIAMQFAIYSRTRIHLFNVDVQVISRRAQLWHSSLNDANKEDLIEVVELRPKDDNEVDKAAVFYSQSGRVQLHRATWQAYNEQQKVELVVLELLGLAGLEKNRYQVAREVVAESWQEILSIDIKKFDDSLTLRDDLSPTGMTKLYIKTALGIRSNQLQKCDAYYENCSAVKVLKSEKLNSYRVLSLRPGYYKYYPSEVPLHYPEGFIFPYRFDSVQLQKPTKLYLTNANSYLLPSVEVKLPKFSGLGAMQLRIVPLAKDIDETIETVTSSLVQKAGYPEGYRIDLSSLSVRRPSPNDLLEIGARDICDYVRVQRAVMNHKAIRYCNSTIRAYRNYKDGIQVQHLMSAAYQFYEDNSLRVYALKPTDKFLPYPLSVRYYNQLRGMGYVAHQSEDVSDGISMHENTFVEVALGWLYRLSTETQHIELEPGRYRVYYQNESGETRSKDFEIFEDQIDYQLRVY